MSRLLPRARVATLPADRLYWARLDGAAAKGLRGRARVSALSFALEPELPVPIEEAVAVFAPDASGSICACACALDELTALRLSADVVRPETVPEWLGTALGTKAFDLLRGLPPAGRGRRAVRIRTAATVLVCAAFSALVTTGMLRRAESAKHDRAELTQAIAAAQGLVLTPAGPGAQPASIRLAAELRAVTAAGVDAGPGAAPDAHEALREILARWPEGARLKRLSIGKRDIRADLSLAAGTDPAPLLASLESMKGWSLASPVIRPSPDETTVSIGLTRTEAPR
jgi:hypothetical protein